MRIERKNISRAVTLAKWSSLAVAGLETTDIAIKNASNNMSHESFYQALGVISISVVVAALSEIIKRTAES